MSTVRPELGEPLPALLARPLRQDQRRVRLGILLVALVAVVLLVAVSLLRSGQALQSVVVRTPVAFNLAHTSALERVAPQGGEVLSLRTPSGASTQMRFTARPLDLGALRGDPTAALGVRASRDSTTLARTLPGYAPRGDGKARINDAAGYVLSFNTRLDGRAAYGKRYYLVPPVAPGKPAPTEGVQLDLVATRGSVFPNPSAIGKNGALKAPLSSFRFGTERP